MATKALTIVAKVKDAASGELTKVQKSIRDTGKAINKTGADFTQFNRVMFTTKAYIGLFTNAFSSMVDLISKGADIDRLSTQFERVLGPKGDLFKEISAFTDNSIDRMEALKAAISMKNLGIETSTTQIAHVIARAGTAAKMAGLDSAEGIKKYNEFLKTGSLSSLEFLNLIRTGNPALKAQMSILQHAGGIMGEALTASQRLAMGNKLLILATQGSLKGQRDLADVVLDSTQSFSLLKREIGTFVGESLRGLLDILSKAVFTFTDMLENVRKNHKEILFLVKAFSLAAAAAGALALVIGTLRLSFMAMNALGFGVPKTLLLLTALGALFLGVTSKTEKFGSTFDNIVAKLQVFGAVFQGAFQLVSSFMNDPENFAKGVGQMDKAIYQLLQKNGLIELVKNIARVGAIIGTFTKNVVQSFLDVTNFLDRTIGSIARAVLRLFGADQKEAAQGWARTWIDSSSKVYTSLSKVVGLAGVLLGSFKLFRSFTGLLQSLPLIGKIFGGGRGRAGAGPSGTASDPIYVTMAGGGLAQAGAAAAAAAKGTAGAAGGGSFLAALGFSTTSLLVFAGQLAAVTAGFAFLSGIVKGVYDNFGSFKGLFGATLGYLGSVDWQSTIITPLQTAFSNFADWISGMLARLSAFLSNIPVIGPALNKLYEAGQATAGAAAAAADLGTYKLQGMTVANELQKTRTTGIVPEMPSSQAEAGNFLNRAITETSGAEQQQLARGMREAMQGTSAGGTAITKEEWEAIFLKALNNAELNKHSKKTAENTKKEPNFNNAAGRRGC